MTINKGLLYGLVAVTITLVILKGFGKPEYCTNDGNVDEYAKKMKIEKSVAQRHLNEVRSFRCR